jgi:Protein of unknown function (DUF3168)
MPSPAWSLQQAMFGALSADAALTALLGAGRIYDDVPQATSPPYVVLGPITARDWSTATEAGTEHVIALHVWSRARGKKQTHDIMETVRAALHDQPLSVSGYRLVNLRHESSDIRRDPDGETIHGTLRFRAVTEPAYP